MAGVRNSFLNSTRGILISFAAALCVAAPGVAADHAQDEPDADGAATEESSAAADESDLSSDPAISAIDAFIAKQNVDKSQEDWKEHVKAPPMVTFALDKTYYWNLKTNKGEIKIRLMPKVAPYHVASTIYLTRMGFYDDVKFHRVIPGFMAQGGDPTGTGRGGPGYRYAGEFDADVTHDKAGKLSMANSGPDTDGSQFFITFSRTSNLDGKHTIFGEVAQGMTTVRRLEKAGSPRGKPTRPLFIESATISVQ